MSPATTAPSPRCALCGAAGPGERVYTGPSLGTVHHSCFVAWDRVQEAEELTVAPLRLDLLELGAAVG